MELLADIGLKELELVEGSWSDFTFFTAVSSLLRGSCGVRRGSSIRL